MSALQHPTRTFPMRLYAFNMSAGKSAPSLIAPQHGDLGRDIRLATLVHGQPCNIEDTTYNGLNSAGDPMSVQVTRDDCKRPYFFCDRSTLACQPTKFLGVSCEEDRECISVRRTVRIMPRLTMGLPVT